MKCIKIFGYVLLALFFISTVPYAAEAGKIKIYPHQFKPRNPSDPHNYQTPSYLLGNAGTAMYYAVVQLPIGSTVTRWVVFHSSSVGASVSEVYLYRSQFGRADPYHRLMDVTSASGHTGDEAVPFEDTTFDYPKVKSGFRYWVEVNVGNGNRLHGVKVQYE